MPTKEIAFGELKQKTFDDFIRKYPLGTIVPGLVTFVFNDHDNIITAMFLYDDTKYKEHIKKTPETSAESDKKFEKVYGKQHQ